MEINKESLQGQIKVLDRLFKEIFIKAKHFYKTQFQYNEESLTNILRYRKIPSYQQRDILYDNIIDLKDLIFILSEPTKDKINKMLQNSSLISPKVKMVDYKRKDNLITCVGEINFNYPFWFLFLPFLEPKLQPKIPVFYKNFKKKYTLQFGKYAFVYYNLSDRGKYPNIQLFAYLLNHSQTNDFSLDITYTFFSPINIKLQRDENIKQFKKNIKQFLRQFPDMPQFKRIKVKMDIEIKNDVKNKKFLNTHNNIFFINDLLKVGTQTYLSFILKSIQYNLSFSPESFFKRINNVKQNLYSIINPYNRYTVIKPLYKKQMNFNYFSLTITSRIYSNNVQVNIDTHNTDKKELNNKVSVDMNITNKIIIKFNIDESTKDKIINELKYTYKMTVRPVWENQKITKWSLSVFSYQNNNTIDLLDYVDKEGNISWEQVAEDNEKYVNKSIEHFLTAMHKIIKGLSLYDSRLEQTLNK